MLKVLAHSWPLLLGVMLLMVGNGVQGSLLGIRGAMEGFSTTQLSVVMSAYFLGFLGGSRLAPEMIRRVGHVRVFSALGSLISAVLVLYPLLIDWQAWAMLRVVIGFCFSGIYVTAESWVVENPSTAPLIASKDPCTPLPTISNITPSSNGQEWARTFSMFCRPPSQLHTGTNTHLWSGISKDASP